MFKNEFSTKPINLSLFERNVCTHTIRAYCMYVENWTNRKQPASIQYDIYIDERDIRSLVAVAHIHTNAPATE